MENKKLKRSMTNKKIAGVCGGFAEYFNTDATIIRIIALILLCCVGGGLLAYLICWIAMPTE
ncbi:MAG: PspC domain-containing protein [Bacteroidales bacterium]|nr:PspC domain-containing protein [Bacteroidales bacterium]